MLNKQQTTNNKGVVGVCNNFCNGGSNHIKQNSNNSNHIALPSYSDQ